MGGQGESWSTKFRKRHGNEQLWASAFVGLSLWGVVSGWWLVSLGIALILTSHVRGRAVMHHDEERAKERIFLTDPVLELTSIAILVYVLGTIVRDYPLPVAGDPLVIVSLLSLGLSVLLLLVERFSTGDYFSWWGERALEKARPNSNEFWLFAASWCFKLSGREPTPEEVRRIRSRQRISSGSFTPETWRDNPPSPKPAWLSTIALWTISYGRLLGFVVGLILLSSIGYGGLVLWGATAMVFLTTSLLADHIKFLYHYQPLLEEREVESVEESTFNIVAGTAKQHWVATVLSFSILWIVF